MARPTFVKRKKRYRSATIPSDTPITPKSWMEKATPPTLMARVEKALGKARVSPPQIQNAAPFSPISRPTVTITIATTGARSTGLITTRSTATPPRNASPSVAKKAAQ